MGKKGGSAPAAPDPYKTASAEAQFNRLDTYSPSGSGQVYGYTDPKTGKFVQGVAPQGAQSAVSTIESPYERAIREAWQPASLALTDRFITDNVANLPAAAKVGDKGTIAQDIFDRTLSTMLPGIEKANSKLLTNLQARGIPVGADAFNDAYGSQLQQTQDTISRLALDAQGAAGSEQSRQFGLDAAARQNAMSEIMAAMGGSYNPPSSVASGNAAGVNYSGLVGDKYQADLAAYNAKQQQSASTAGTLGTLGASMIMKSDRRLKRDIRLIGRRGPLNLYEYRYLWDTPGTVRRGYMAQEVAKVFPRAVVWALGFMALDYAQLPEIEA